MGPWNLSVVRITETARSRLRKKAREIKKGLVSLRVLRQKECTEHIQRNVLEGSFQSILTIAETNLYSVS